MTGKATIVWFRRDLRLHDNGALSDACTRGDPVIPVYILDVDSRDGAASRWWLHYSLKSLETDLAKHKARLIVRRGRPLDVLRRLITESGAGTVLWNRLYEPDTMPRDSKIKEALRKDGITTESFAGHLLFEPHFIANKQGDPYKVFTPFWKHLTLIDEPPAPLQVPRIPHFDQPLRSLAIEDLNLLPRIDWAMGLRSMWTPGEAGSHERFAQFFQAAVDTYETNRDRPDLQGTSRLSPHLHFGEISPRTIWHMANREMLRNPTRKAAARAFLRQVGWREFSAHLLYHYPHLVDQPLREEFKSFPWKKDSRTLRAWQKGLTGFPIVDAGMRELWHTGWMHNRVRMIVASFLVKDLMIPWQSGAEWFWDTLVDADMPNNSMGWQWTAGCGADAAPYFRVFNPILQGAKFDPDGSYIRRWIPELAALPAKHIHAPWEAPPAIRRAARIDLGTTYPEPIVNHSAARDEALAAFQKIKKN